MSTFCLGWNFGSDTRVNTPGLAKRSSKGDTENESIFCLKAENLSTSITCFSALGNFTYLYPFMKGKSLVLWVSSGFAIHL